MRLLLVGLAELAELVSVDVSLMGGTVFVVLSLSSVLVEFLLMDAAFSVRLLRFWGGVPSSSCGVYLMRGVPSSSCPFTTPLMTRSHVEKSKSSCLYCFRSFFSVFVSSTDIIEQLISPTTS